MKKRILKLIALALVVLTAFSVVGCSGCDWSMFDALFEIQPEVPSGADNPNLPNASDTGLQYTETEPIETELVLPPLESGEIDFDNLALTLLIPDTLSYRREWGQKEAVDELDEAIVLRNRYVNEELGLEIQYEFVPNDEQTYFDFARGGVLNGTHDYDIAVNESAVMSRLAYSGALENMLDVQQFPYFDFTNECWNVSQRNNLAINGKLYFATGFFSTRLLDNISLMFVNATVYEKYRENGYPESLQDYAIDGKWTYEEMYRLMQVYSDAALGRSALVIDSDFDNGDLLKSFAAAFDVNLMKLNNGKWEYDVIGNSKAEDVLGRTDELDNSPLVIREDENKFVGNLDEKIDRYSKGYGVLFLTKLYKDYESNETLREMEDKYGIMPLPKYDVYQEQYTALSTGASFIGILKDSNADNSIHGLAISAFLEKTAERSHYQVLGYYFNRVVKPKYFGTDDKPGTVTKSIKLFDILVNNIEFEFCNVYSEQLGGIGNIWSDAYSSGLTLEQAYQARQQEYSKALDEINSWIGQK